MTATLHAVDVELRAVTPADLPAFLAADATAFGAGGWGEEHATWAADELERAVAAWADDALVGTSRAYSFEVTVPGERVLPVAGITSVGVLPTHRRRGILGRMLARLLDDARARGEAAAVLVASESGIYGRFGFGVSTRALRLEVDTREAVFSTGPEPGRVRLVGLDEARALEPELFDRVRRRRPGALTRRPSWWTDEHWTRAAPGTRFDVVSDGPAGRPEGYAVYGIVEDWTPAGPHHRLALRELVAVTARAERALWSYLCGVDLVRTLTAWCEPVDTPLPWMLVAPGAVRVVSRRDFVWARLLDVPAALAGRAYACPGRLVLDVHDPARPATARRFALEGGPDGAEVRAVSAPPDLECDVATLGAAWLGGVRLTTLARAGRVEEHTAGALARADAMFATEPAPFSMTWF